MFELFDPQAEFVINAGTNLPHWYQPAVTYFVTFRTEDSIPADVSHRWHAARSEWLRQHGITDYDLQFPQLPVQQRKAFHETFSQQYLDALDRGLGECVLARPELSLIVANSLLHFNSERYHLGDFVIMPNHVHLIVCLLGDTQIQSQCTSWKRFAARQINLALNRRGRFWQEDSFDHLIRSPEQFAAIQQYIAANPRNLNKGEYYLHLLASGGRQ